MLKQTYIEDDEIVTCDNCEREIKRKYLVLHGKGFCSKEPTKTELAIEALKRKLTKLQLEAKERAALSPEIQKCWDEICSSE